MDKMDEGKVVGKVEEGTEDKVVDKVVDRAVDKVEEDKKDEQNKSKIDSKDQHSFVLNQHHSTYTLSSVANEDHDEVVEEHLNPRLALLVD